MHYNQLTNEQLNKKAGTSQIQIWERKLIIEQDIKISWIIPWETGWIWPKGSVLTLMSMIHHISCSGFSYSWKQTQKQPTKNDNPFPLLVSATILTATMDLDVESSYLNMKRKKRVSLKDLQANVIPSSTAAKEISDIYCFLDCSKLSSLWHKAQPGLSCWSHSGDPRLPSLQHIHQWPGRGDSVFIES